MVREDGPPVESVWVQFFLTFLEKSEIKTKKLRYTMPYVGVSFGEQKLQVAISNGERRPPVPSVYDDTMPRTFGKSIRVDSRKCVSKRRRRFILTKKKEDLVAFLGNLLRDKEVEPFGQYVVSLPPYYDYSDRAFIKEVFRMAGKGVRMMNSLTAVAALYVINGARISEFCVVDFGFSQTSIAFFTFTEQDEKEGKGSIGLKKIVSTDVGALHIDNKLIHLILGVTNCKPDECVICRYVINGESDSTDSSIDMRYKIEMIMSKLDEVKIQFNSEYFKTASVEVEEPDESVRTVEITKKEYEDAIRDVVEKIGSFVEKNIEPNMKVEVVGGNSNNYMVRRFTTKYSRSIGDSNFGLGTALAGMIYGGFAKINLFDLTPPVSWRKCAGDELGERVLVCDGVKVPSSLKISFPEGCERVALYIGDVQVGFINLKEGEKSAVISFDSSGLVSDSPNFSPIQYNMSDVMCIELEKLRNEEAITRVRVMRSKFRNSLFYLKRDMSNILKYISNMTGDSISQEMQEKLSLDLRNVDNKIPKCGALPNEEEEVRLEGEWESGLKSIQDLFDVYVSSLSAKMDEVEKGYDSAKERFEDNSLPISYGLKRVDHIMSTVRGLISGVDAPSLTIRSVEKWNLKNIDSIVIEAENLLSHSEEDLEFELKERERKETERKEAEAKRVEMEKQKQKEKEKGRKKKEKEKKEGEKEGEDGNENEDDKVDVKTGDGDEIHKGCSEDSVGDNNSYKRNMNNKVDEIKNESDNGGPKVDNKVNAGEKDGEDIVDDSERSTYNRRRESEKISP